MPLPPEIKIYASTNMLGGAITTQEIPDDGLHAVFPPISGDVAAAGGTEYACIYIKNVSAETLFRVKIYIKSQPDTGRTVKESFAIGFDPDVGSPVQSIPNLNTPPSGVQFDTPTSADTAIEIPLFPPGAVQALWLKRTIPAGTQPAGVAKCVLSFSFIKIVT